MEIWDPQTLIMQIMSESPGFGSMDFFETDCLFSCVFTFLRGFWLWWQFYSFPYYVILNYIRGRDLLMCHGVCQNILHPISTIRATEFFVMLPGYFIVLHHCTFAILYLLYWFHRYTHCNGFPGFVWQTMSSESWRAMTPSNLSLLFHIMWWIASIKLISSCWCYWYFWDH